MQRRRSSLIRKGSKRTWQCATASCNTRTYVDYLQNVHVETSVPSSGKKMIKSRGVITPKYLIDGQVVRFWFGSFRKNLSKHLSWTRSSFAKLWLDILHKVLFLHSKISVDTIFRNLISKNAFFNGKILENIYQEAPRNESVDRNEWSWSWLLKSLYGFKEAARAWHEEFENYLSQMVSQWSGPDPSLSYKREHEIFYLVMSTILIFRRENRMLQNAARKIKKKSSICVDWKVRQVCALSMKGVKI